jgi:hypothetical protein
VRIVVCTQCRKVIQIGGDPREIKGLLGNEDSFACVTPLCGGRMRKLREGISIQGFETLEMPVQTFFRGINGFGTGTGAAASLARARELLLNEKIVEVVGESAGEPERVILRRLVLHNGTTLHFDTSSKGACLYYIEEAGPSCVEVFDDDEVSNRAATEVSNPDREEVGRAPSPDADVGPIAEQDSGAADAAAPEQSGTGGVPSVPETSRVPEDADSECTGDGDHPHVRV